MPADVVTSCPAAAARFSEQGKVLDTARCGLWRPVARRPGHIYSVSQKTSPTFLAVTL